LAEAEAELDEMTGNRDELQGVVEELEEKVMHLANAILLIRNDTEPSPIATLCTDLCASLAGNQS